MILPGGFTVPAGFEAAAGLIESRFDPAAHGDMSRWLAALDALPPLQPERLTFGSTVTIAGQASAAERRQLERALMELHPWRKGPFALFGVSIDTEWRSDWKWARIAGRLGPLSGERVLDVGGGNGYFGWRMLEAGAREVVGVDPTLVFCMQHLAVNAYARNRANHVLPLRFEELPAGEFDTVFSMGVIYHRRQPLEHTERLFRHTRPGGRVVLESLVVDGPVSLEPAGRYARMRNVWTVPGTPVLEDWLRAAGFTEVETVDVTRTTPDEQRSTPWMHFESLRDALDPADPERTIEGHPAPRRAMVLARKPV